MKRYNLIIAVTLALVLIVSGAEAKKFARAHEQVQNVSVHGFSIMDLSVKIRSMIADISFATSKFKNQRLNEDVTPVQEGNKPWSNDVPVNDVPPYYDPNVTPKDGTSGSIQDFGVRKSYGGKKPIRWFMQYKAYEDND